MKTGVIMAMLPQWSCDTPKRIKLTAIAPMIAKTTNANGIRTLSALVVRHEGVRLAPTPALLLPAGQAVHVLSVMN